MSLFKKNFSKNKIQPQKKKEANNDFPWLSGKKKTLTLEEVANIEELLED